MHNIQNYQFDFALHFSKSHYYQLDFVRFEYGTNITNLTTLQIQLSAYEVLETTYNYNIENANNILNGLPNKRKQA